MNYRVHKFGGSSLATEKHLEKVARLVLAQEGPKAVVVSAQGDATDVLEAALEAAALGKRDLAETLIDSLQHQGEAERALKNELQELLLGVSLLREVSLATKDLVLSHGERLSVLRLAKTINRLRENTAIAVDARDFLLTNDNFGEARVSLLESKEKLSQLLPQWQGQIAIVTGFIGATRDGRTTTLGRGGSDYSATLLGRFIEAQEVQIWTDVPGVMTADPALVPGAQALSHLSYDEALELSIFGARVLHQRTLIPLLGSNIPLRVKETQNPLAEGTLIDSEGAKDQAKATSVTSLENQALFEISIRRVHHGPELGERLHRALEDAGCQPWLVTHSGHGQGISTVVPIAQAGALRRALHLQFEGEFSRGDLAPLSVMEPVALLSVVGQAMGQTSGVAARLFGALEAIGVNVLSIGQSGSTRSVSCVISQEELSVAVHTVHAAFHFSAQKLSLFLLGTGTVGGALIQELSRQKDSLLKDHDLEPTLVGVATSKTIAFRPEGLGSGEIQTLAKPQKLDSSLLEQLSRLPVPILMDCTAAEGMEALYEEALRLGIHVVAANKKALTTPTEVRDQLLSIARRSHRSFRYEATVGAALPVVSTLHDLLRTGDEVQRIEGALSGSLGFICQKISAGVPLHVAVSEAREKGFTEPRPQEDLSGKDVARKALILAREMGFNLDLDQVEVEPLVATELLEIADPAVFVEALAQQEAQTQAWVTRKCQGGRSLRYLAVIDPSQKPAVKVGPVAVEAEHPAALLAGNQALVAFTTRRYGKHPLVVLGAGAGGEITASAVLAEAFRIGKGLTGGRFLSQIGVGILKTQQKSERAA